jgi:hypothetical protein
MSRVQNASRQIFLAQRLCRRPNHDQPSVLCRIGIEMRPVSAGGNYHIIHSDRAANGVISECERLFRRLDRSTNVAGVRDFDRHNATV